MEDKKKDLMSRVQSYANASITQDELLIKIAAKHLMELIDTITFPEDKPTDQLPG